MWVFCSCSVVVVFMIIVCNLILAVSLFHFGHTEAEAFGDCLLGSARGRKPFYHLQYMEHLDSQLFFFFLRLAFDTLIQLSNLFLGTTLFESGREWGFILVIAAAYFEGENLKSMNSAPSRNWLLMAAVGRKSGTQNQWRSFISLHPSMC